MQAKPRAQGLYQATGFYPGSEIPFVSVAMRTDQLATRAPEGTSSVFRPILPQIKPRTQVAILLPGELPVTLPDDTIYVNGMGEADEYSIVVGHTPDCSGATVCSIGSFNAKRGGKVYPDEFEKTVSLVRGITAYFSPLTCGASCSPPSIGWEYEGAFYRMHLEIDSRNPSQDEEIMVRLANSAIEMGPR
ncbi:hypothetical protein [Leptolyngbya sp. FACHB-261]|uniref:hypothetical protein n=1 Tax=Leptolyngbya sp. FACHB-261 TaxID=2692806 RepID=UPI00168807CB|nr:hypothetical protein [Leptolyngbya sp. FACHB-261]MBD2101549.1 hypothetical protein [Leptolyngbya sp. FACHB-261]